MFKDEGGPEFFGGVTPVPEPAEGQHAFGRVEGSVTWRNCANIAAQSNA
jgi:hypothetical protein